MKDRVALEIIQEALAEGRLAPGGLVTEGTVGSTGVSLAMCAAAAGCQAFIAMPDDAAIEKAQILQVGATAGQHIALGPLLAGRRSQARPRRTASLVSGCCRRRWARRCSGCAPCPSRTPTTL